MAIRDNIIKVLKENSELKASEIASITGLDKKLVDKEIAKLKKEDVIISPKRCYWSVK
ncbi:MAG: ArsR family transcriptional regulator [Bacteroidales bacterium]|jgi:predicted transcriptional regulator|nr:ArsR family transcriptional regulator [Bacteroidales bacterium]MDD4216848.1 ArsR family transcriptional regulator [Bacteroidales bacterium]MDY0142257.1 ArsR family transcriptional regulator [Bacteroidales bacterium]